MKIKKKEGGNGPFNKTYFFTIADPSFWSGNMFEPTLIYIIIKLFVGKKGPKQPLFLL